MLYSWTLKIRPCPIQTVRRFFTFIFGFVQHKCLNVSRLMYQKRFLGHLTRCKKPNSILDNTFNWKQTVDTFIRFRFTAPRLINVYVILYWIMPAADVTWPFTFERVSVDFTKFRLITSNRGHRRAQSYQPSSPHPTIYKNFSRGCLRIKSAVNEPPFSQKTNEKFSAKDIRYKLSNYVNTIRIAHTLLVYYILLKDFRNIRETDTFTL